MSDKLALSVDLDDVIKAVREGGYLVFKIDEIPDETMAIIAEKAGDWEVFKIEDANDSQVGDENAARVVDHFSVDVLVASLVRRKDELTDVESLFEELGGEWPGLDYGDSVVIQATVAATSSDWREVADALKRLKQELRERGIYGRAQLDLLR